MNTCFPGFAKWSVFEKIDHKKQKTSKLKKDVCFAVVYECCTSEFWKLCEPHVHKSMKRLSAGVFLRIPFGIHNFDRLFDDVSVLFLFYLRMSAFSSPPILTGPFLWWVVVLLLFIIVQQQHTTQWCEKLGLLSLEIRLWR